MKKSLLIIIIALLLFSFTRIKYIPPYKGFNLKKFEKSLAMVPKGIISYDPEEESMIMKESPPTYQTKIDSFYMCNHEVSNGEYLEFINDIKKTDTNLYRQMFPDTIVWRNNPAYNEPLVELYLRHPAYSYYPVVGISYEQAEYFCKWLTEKYKNEGKRKYRNAIFKLPTKDQWLYAFLGEDGCRPFPWHENSLQNKKGKWLANFHIIPQSSICKIKLDVKDSNNICKTKTYLASEKFTWESIVNPYSDMPTYVISYYPNEYGIYNMAGNVSEYVKEKGITKGGGWFDTGYYLSFYAEQKYDSTNITSSERGFRFIMEIQK